MKKINLKKEEEKTSKTKQITAQKVFSVNEIRHCHRQFLTVKLEIRIRFEIRFEIRTRTGPYVFYYINETKTYCVHEQN